MSEWGQPLFYLQVDLEDAFGSNCHDDLLRELTGRVVVQTATAVMRGMVGHSLKPSWLGVEGEELDVGKGLRQGDRPVRLCGA